MDRTRGQSIDRETWRHADSGRDFYIDHDRDTGMYTVWYINEAFRSLVHIGRTDHKEKAGGIAQAHGDRLYRQRRATRPKGATQ